MREDGKARERCGKGAGKVRERCGKGHSEEKEGLIPPPALATGVTASAAVAAVEVQ